MDDLVAWLRACLDDDEREAKAASLMFGRPTSSHYEAWDRHIARWDPARVLAEVEAKRTRIAMLVDTMSLVSSQGEEVKCDRAPKGWWCSRVPGHDGPCAARPRWWNLFVNLRRWRNW